MPGYERRLSMEALALLACTTVGLRVAGFRRLSRFVARAAAVSRHVPAPQPSPASAARAVERAGHYLPADSRCLARSTALWWLLRRHGYCPELRVGARKAAGAVEAHAWVELAGQVLNDLPDVGQRFVPFDHHFFRAPREGRSRGPG